MQPEGVAQKYPGDHRVQPAVYGNGLGLHHGGKDVLQGLHQFVHPEGGNLDGKFFGLYFGEVQHRIQKVQKELPGVAGLIYIVPLFFVKGRTGEELKHAQYAVHGGAYFMAHGRQESRLAGSLGPRFFLRQAVDGAGDLREGPTQGKAYSDD